jgi:hypothetical protein
VRWKHKPNNDRQDNEGDNDQVTDIALHADSSTIAVSIHHLILKTISRAFSGESKGSMWQTLHASGLPCPLAFASKMNLRLHRDP